jgi:hypothetical protein
MKFEYGLKQGPNFLPLGSADDQFKTKRTLIDAIMDTRVDTGLEVQDGEKFCRQLGINNPYKLSADYIYFYILAAHARICQREGHRETDLQSDIFPTSYYFSSGENDRILVGHFYYSNEHSADAMFPTFASLVDKEMKKEHGYDLSMLIHAHVKKGYSLFALENGKPVLLFSPSDAHQAFGQKTTLNFLKYKHVQAA